MHYEKAKSRADICKALGHPVRVIVVEALRKGERCVCELNPLVAVDQSTLSRHLAQLKHAGLLTERREGVRVFYRLAHPEVLKFLDRCQDVLASRRKADWALAQ
jgi:DNA-binding transcriptional ArsR family regulator